MDPVLIEVLERETTKSDSATLFRLTRPGPCLTGVGTIFS